MTGEREKFRQHFPDSMVNETDSFIEYRSSSSFLRVGEDGSVEAEMPLHSFSSDSYESIDFEDEQVEIVSGDVRYVFRK